MADVQTPDNFSLLQTYTPGSDIAAAFLPGQLIWGRTGNDILLGFDPVTFSPGDSNIDVLIGDLELPQLVDPSPRDWSNQFLLGDYQKAYYTEDSSFLGLGDFTLLLDFDPTRDTIQLFGRSSDYFTVDIFIGTLLFKAREEHSQNFNPNLVAFILTPGLALQADYFQYKGYEAPPAEQSLIAQLGTTGYEIAIGTAKDAAGNVYVVGGTSGDLAGVNSGNRDVWFAKYDSSGNELWKKQFGGESFDFAFGIGVDGDSNIYITGNTEGFLFNEQTGIADAWLAKFDSNGDLLWGRQFGNEGYFVHRSYAIDVTSDGLISLSGTSVKNTPDGSDLPTTDDGWVATYDSDGNQLVFTQFQTINDVNSFEEGFANALDSAGNVVVAGFTTGAYGSNGLSGLYDAFVSKFDSSGQQVWATNIGSIDYDWAWGVDTDSLDNVYVAGWTLGTLGDANLGSFDAWLAKYDKDGNRQWIRQFGTPGDDQAFSVRVGPDDSVYVTGYTDGTFVGANSGLYDAWVVKFDESGNQVWKQQFGSSDSEQSYDLVVTGDSVYVTGLTNGSLGDENAGSFDSWVAKLDVSDGRVLDFSGNKPPAPEATESQKILAAQLELVQSLLYPISPVNVTKQSNLGSGEIDAITQFQGYSNDTVSPSSPKPISTIPGIQPLTYPAQSDAGAISFSGVFPDNLPYSDSLESFPLVPTLGIGPSPLI